MPSVANIQALLPWLLAAAQVLAAEPSPPVTMIHTLAQLQALRHQPQGDYALGASIDASATAGWNDGAGFVPIGAGGAPFTGSFDGRGHTISGLFIHRPGEDKVGLFGHARNARLRNLGLVGGQITGAEKVGALVGHNEAIDGNARIDQVCALVPVSAAGTTGGLVGHNEAYRGNSTISRSHAGAAVVATGSLVGGLVGHNEAYGGTASIADAYASGAVAGRDYVGGLVGYNDALRGAAPISDSHASATVRASGAVAGGLVGLDTAGGIVRSFYASTDAQGRPLPRHGSSAGEGRTWEQLRQLPSFTRWQGAQCLLLK